MALSQKTFRIDDIGASTKQFEQYGRRGIEIGRFKVPIWFTSIGPLKRIPGLCGWGPYNELTVSEWAPLIEEFVKHSITPIIAVTASWVDESSNLTPFPRKFPEEAALLKRLLHEGTIKIANHGLTHCVVGKHLPRALKGNREFHREFLPALPADLHRWHVRESQRILESFFERPITIFVPPGNLWSKKTYAALKETNIREVRCSRYMMDSDEPMEDIKFIKDDKNAVSFHDRELKLWGRPWLSRLIERHRAE